MTKRLLLLCACMLVASGASAHKKPAKKAHPKAAAAAPAAPAPKKAEEKVEEVDLGGTENVDPNAGGDAAKSNSDKGPLGPIDYLGHMHGAVVHMPIAWLVILFALEVAILLFNRIELMAAGLYLSVLTLLSFFPAALTGLIRVGQLPQDPEAIAPALLHRNIMYGCIALCCAIAGIRVVRRDDYHEGPLRWVYLALITFAVGLVTLGGHMGGKLVYGDDFFPF